MIEEIWKTIPLYPNFLASNLGQIKHATRGTVRVQTLDRYGYKFITVNSKGRQKALRVHKAVAAAFLGDPCGLVVNHKDQDRTNNRAENLEYVTIRENTTNGKNCKKKHTGAMLNKRTGSWVSNIMVGGKLKRIGSYPTEAEASNAYKQYLKDNGLENRYAK